MSLLALSNKLLYATRMENEVLYLAPDDRQELETRSRSRMLPAGDVRRAKAILMLADGKSYREIQRALACDAGYVGRWKRRFIESGLSGLYGLHRGSTAEVLTPQMEARILSATRKKPTDGSTHWSTRKLAVHLGVNHMRVARVWQRAGLQPHRMKR